MLSWHDSETTRLVNWSGSVEMFRIKICGVTSAQDAEAVASAGADAIGLNFYESSSRYVDVARAEEILRAVPDQLVKVGVFVNSAVDQVRSTADRLDLDVIQLHGDEPPPFLGLLEGRTVMRAFRCGQTGLAPLSEYLLKCKSLGCLPRYVLVDAYYPGQYGGTGRVADWNAIAQSRQHFQGVRLVLAGGLNSDNVARAIATVRPTAVDTATGVESKIGCKDAQIVRSFVLAARRAFAETETVE